MKSIHLKKLFLLLLFSVTSLLASSIGNASWYGEEFHGKKTASGELFNMYDYTAAHPSYAFGTMLKVTNLSNHKSIKVRVTDRGPYKDNRIIDLSFQAAEELDMIESGVAKVKVEKIDIQSSSPSEIYPIEEDEIILNVRSTTERVDAPKKEKIKLQIASFSKKENAEKFIIHEKNTYEMKVEEVYVKHLGKTLYKVVILCDSSAMVQEIRDSKKYKGAYILSKNVD
jgi:rare lipoprotein A